MLQQREQAQLCGDVWLPAGERHFREVLEAIAHEGRSAIYPSLAAAMLFVEKRRRAIDIGAHVGLWSRWLVDFFEKVDAFEPIKEHAELFERNVVGNRWRLHNVALGSEARSVGMKLYSGDTGRSHVCGTGQTQMVRLDAFGFEDVDLIKIDVEGYELQVLRGAERTLLECKPIIIIEQRGCEVLNFGEGDPDQAMDYLLSLGMRRILPVGCDWVMGWKSIVPRQRSIGNGNGNGGGIGQLPYADRLDWP